MNSRACLLAASLLFVGAAPSLAVEHPGVVPKEAECTSCHAAKVRGKSVHSVMATSCDVCHVTQTQGDMMMVSLSMPKQKICFACHQESAALREHVPAVKGQCIDCHDAHSSDRNMLLRVAALSSGSRSQQFHSWFFSYRPSSKGEYLRLHAGSTEVPATAKFTGMEIEPLR